MSTGKLKNFKLHRVCKLCLKEGGIPKIGCYIRAWIMQNYTKDEFPKWGKTNFFVLLCKDHFEELEKGDKERGFLMVPYFYIDDDIDKFKEAMIINKTQK